VTNHDPSFTIRRAASADTDAIENLTRDVFWTFIEPGYTVHHNHLAISVLRGAEGYVPELDLVAVDNDGGEIVGHIIYTRSRIVPTSPNTHRPATASTTAVHDVVPTAIAAEQDHTASGVEVLTFGPLTVRGARQGQGVGRALIEYSFAEALRLGIVSGPGQAPAVVILGVPDYYPRLGFRRGSEFGLTFGGYSFDALLAYPLVDGALDGVQGDLVVDPAHGELTPEAAAEFDKKFPPRQPHVPTPIDTLADTIGQDAVDAMRAAGVDTIEAVTEYSQAELATMTNLAPTGQAEVATAVRNATGRRWGRGVCQVFGVSG